MSDVFLFVHSMTMVGRADGLKRCVGLLAFEAPVVAPERSQSTPPEGSCGAVDDHGRATLPPKAHCYSSPSLNPLDV